ncbi:XRE family transcriptional regulator [Pseudorhodobacter sp.]|uniref:XRE family transcriptional regulator n=1 Tax=Pseudorhodobacter sp. TaxID=1934400 RepID=UPI0026496703|nr:S24 family peptidase [Pseudorhodobacter sp.]MDN5785709.1 hypothetical protein [Pseudorhodobacter sp.]
MTVNTKGERLSTFSGRLRAERERMLLSQSAFGEACGVGKNSQINYESEKRSPDSSYLIAAAELGADILYILTGERSAKSLPGLVSMPSFDDPSDFAPIRVYDAELAAGDGATNGDAAMIGHLAFRRDWLKRLGVSASAAIIARARGDSMAPTFHDGDVVLIDQGRAQPPAKPRAPEDQRAPAIYAILDDGQARIKRLAFATSDTLAVLSDNPIFPPEFRPLQSLTILGQVMWWGHTNHS